MVAFQFGGQSARNRIAASYKVPSSPTADSGDSGPAHHPWTHQNKSDIRGNALGLFMRFYATQVALLIDSLKTTLDASGKPLLDSTVIVWASELGGSPMSLDGHHTGGIPVALFGKGQGAFRTGRYLRGKSVDSVLDGQDSGQAEAGRDMAKLLISLMRYMGLTDVNRVGLSDASGPLLTLS